MELSAIYYPYARPNNIDNMKKAILLFDNIYFISPQKENSTIGMDYISENPSYYGSNMDTLPPQSLDIFSYNDPFSKGIFREIDSK